MILTNVNTEKEHYAVCLESKVTDIKFNKDKSTFEVEIELNLLRSK